MTFKIGIVCPIGDLKRFGYARISDITIQSYCDFADRIVLVQSAENCNLNVENSKIGIISNPDTWFTEGYTIKKLTENCNTGLESMTDMDVVILMSVNQYIPLKNFAALRGYLYEFAKSSDRFTYLYKMYQCAGKLYNADTRLPWVMKPGHGLRIAPDSLVIPERFLFCTYSKTERLRNGNFTKYNGISIVDVLGEITLEESERLWTYIGDAGGFYKNGYGNHYFDDAGNYKHEIWQKHLRAKYRRKTLAKEELDMYGKTIVNRSDPNYISHGL